MQSKVKYAMKKFTFGIFSGVTIPQEALQSSSPRAYRQSSQVHRNTCSTQEAEHKSTGHSACSKAHCSQVSAENMFMMYFH